MSSNSILEFNSLPAVQKPPPILWQGGPMIRNSEQLHLGYQDGFRVFPLYMQHMAKRCKVKKRTA